MTVFVTRLPDEIGIGAQVTFVPSIAKNTSERGISGRKLMRPPLRQYTVSLSHEISDEMQAIVMATRVSHHPLSFRDPTAYTLVDEPALVAADGLSAKIGKTWEPATGSLSFFDRVVIVDESEENLSITINDLVPGGATWSLGDYGVLQFNPAISPTDIVLVTGQYLKPVCILDPPSAVGQGKLSNGRLLYQFSSMRLEEIFEAEFISLTFGAGSVGGGGGGAGGGLFFAAIKGSYGLSGVAAALISTATRSFPCAPGTYAITGADAVRDETLVVAAGGYALTGVTATLTKP